MARISISIDLGKVDDVEYWKRPTTMTEIRSFIGLAGYYKRFIEGFSKISLPLTRLTRKGVKFGWFDCHTPIPGPTRKAVPNRVRGARL